MNHNKSMNNRINSLHERAPRLIYWDHSSNFQELHREIILWQYIKKKVINNIASTIVSQLFSFSNINYNLRSGSQFHHSSAKNVWNGLEAISYLGPKIWNMVPAEMKQKSFLFSFKGEIKKWIPKNCLCRIYKKYLPGVGYI